MSALEWTKAGEATSNNQIYLPSEWNELQIIVIDDNYRTAYSSLFHKDMLGTLSYMNIVLGGGYGGSESGLCYVRVDNTTCNIKVSIWGNTSRIDNSKLIVYYR